jgi:hypothetical protein
MAHKKLQFLVKEKKKPKALRLYEPRIEEVWVPSLIQVGSISSACSAMALSVWPWLPFSQVANAISLSLFCLRGHLPESVWHSLHGFWKIKF